MKVIHAHNPDEALVLGLLYLQTYGELEGSRNGGVLVSPTPVTTVYYNPKNRVSMWAARDANPFFHLMEALWMLAGQNEVKMLTSFAANMAQFSDDGATLSGAYGHRWRRHFHWDQLRAVIDELRRDPSTRRVVLGMWDSGQYQNASDWANGEPQSDLKRANAGSADIPCNTHIYFRIRRLLGAEGASHPFSELDMTVCCRSNDIVWGAYGANVVHFSVLQEFIAAAVGVNVGHYYQVSNNYHAYVDRKDVRQLLAAVGEGYPANDKTYPQIMPLVGPEGYTVFLEEVEQLLRAPYDPLRYESRFIREIVKPMLVAHLSYKIEAPAEGAMLLADSPYDWHIAGAAWLQRRADRRAGVQEVR